MKTRLLTTLIAVFLALTSWANGTKIADIYYLLDEDTKTASVTYTGNEYDGYSNWETLNPNSTAYKGSITIPSSVSYHSTTYSVTSIGEDAFFNCSGLTSITIPESVTSIGIDAFADCSGLTSITIPSSVTSIVYGAFWGCSGLTSITIPSSVTSIGQYAFADCSGLTSITIPESVTSIGIYAFWRCTGLTSIKVAAGNTKYDSRDNCNAIIETASNTLIAGCMNSTIPNSVTSIGMHAFCECTGLTSITIPSSVTSIGDNAFYGCWSLTSITIPNSVTSIGHWAFEGCEALKRITALRTNPEAYNCSTDACFLYTATLHVPAGCKTAYENCEPWSDFGTIIDDAKAQ